MIPLLALGLDQHQPGQHAGQEGDAQIDEHALGDLADGDGRGVRPTEAQQRRQHGDEEPCVHAVEEHLEDRVEGHQPGRILRVALGQVVPHDDHGNAPGQADHDQADHELRLAAQERDGQHEHQNRADDPVLQQREAQHLVVAEDVAQLFVLHLGQRRVHHQDEAQGNGDAGLRALRPERTDPLAHARRGVAHQYANCHGQEDPERQKPIQEGQFLGGATGHPSCSCLVRIHVSGAR